MISLVCDSCGAVAVPEKRVPSGYSICNKCNDQLEIKLNKEREQHEAKMKKIKAQFYGEESKEVHKHKFDDEPSYLSTDRDGTKKVWLCNGYKKTGFHCYETKVSE